MKKLLTLLFILAFTSSFAQESYPRIQQTKIGQIVLLSENGTIDLKDFGNKECEFNIIASNTNKIILEYIQPSKLSRKGMCAAGEEKGFLLLELDKNKKVPNSEYFLFESCLLMIEIIEQKKTENGVIEYFCENLHNSETFSIQLDINKVDIKKTTTN